MKDVLKLIKEEQEAIENLMIENQNTSSSREIALLHNKKTKLLEITKIIYEYERIK